MNYSHADLDAITSSTQGAETTVSFPPTWGLPKCQNEFRVRGYSRLANIDRVRWERDPKTRAWSARWTTLPEKIESAKEKIRRRRQAMPFVAMALTLGAGGHYDGGGWNR